MNKVIASLLEDLLQSKPHPLLKLVVTREQYRVFTEAGVPPDDLVISDFISSSYEDEPLRTVECPKGPRNRWGGVK